MKNPPSHILALATLTLAILLPISQSLAANPSPGPATATTPAATPTPTEDHPLDSAGMEKFKLEVPANPALPTLFLVGDSTMKVGTAGQVGWGEVMSPFFDPAKINVCNEAIGGRSSRTFQAEGRWDGVLAMIKKGDYVVVQFGHNDAGAINDNFRARASIKGVGEDTQEIDNILTKKHEIVHTFGWYIRKYVTDIQARGATPIVMSLTPRNNWANGRVVRSSGENYGGWAGQAAKATGAIFVDDNEVIAEGLDKLGPDKTMPLYADKKLHSSPDGAKFNAQMAVSGLKGIPGNPLGPYFSQSAASIPAFTGPAEPAPSQAPAATGS